VEHNNWTTPVVEKLDSDWTKLAGADTRTTFELAERSGDSFLDVGCGLGRFYGYLKERRGTEGFTYLGLDSSRAMVEKAREKYPDEPQLFLQHDAVESLLCGADVVLCNEVFIHLLPESQIRLLANLSEIEWKRAIITIQTKPELSLLLPFEVQSVSLKGQPFYNVIQSADSFKAQVRNIIKGATIAEGQRRPLVEDVERVEIVVDRG